MTSATDELRARLTAAMKEVFGEDRRRVRHTLSVLDYAERIARHEPGSREVVVAAAILHDIGIHEAQRRHGSAAGPYQELEGPPIARGILRDLGAEEALVEHVCRIVANHHSARDIDTPEFRIVWDADWLVNLSEQAAGGGAPSLRERIESVFKTPTGKRIAGEELLERR